MRAAPISPERMGSRVAAPQICTARSCSRRAHRVRRCGRAAAGRGVDDTNLPTQWRLLLDTYVAALPRPTVIWGCPPCTPFSSLMYSNWWKMAVDKREEAVRTGFWHLVLTTFLLAYHVAHGGFDIFKHPDKATSWSVPSLAMLPGEVRIVDQCMLGLLSPNGEPPRKRTKV